MKIATLSLMMAACLAVVVRGEDCEKKCHSTCTIKGDPHLTEFDGSESFMHGKGRNGNKWVTAYKKKGGEHVQIKIKKNGKNEYVTDVKIGKKVYNAKKECGSGRKLLSHGNVRIKCAGIKRGQYQKVNDRHQRHWDIEIHSKHHNSRRGLARESGACVGGKHQSECGCNSPPAPHSKPNRHPHATPTPKPNQHPQATPTSKPKPTPEPSKPKPTPEPFFPPSNETYICSASCSAKGDPHFTTFLGEKYKTDAAGKTITMISVDGFAVDAYVDPIGDKEFITKVTFGDQSMNVEECSNGTTSREIKSASIKGTVKCAKPAKGFKEYGYHLDVQLHQTFTVQANAVKNATLDTFIQAMGGVADTECLAGGGALVAEMSGKNLAAKFHCK